MQLFTIVCSVLTCLCFAFVIFIVVLMSFNVRLYRKTAPLEKDPQAQAAVIQEMLNHTKWKPLRNALMLQLCDSLLRAGEKKKARDLFPFVRPKSLFLNEALYWDLKRALN